MTISSETENHEHRLFPDMIISSETENHEHRLFPDMTISSETENHENRLFPDMTTSSETENNCGYLYWRGNDKMSLVTRKPVFGLCDQVRLKPARTAAETS